MSRRQTRRTDNEPSRKQVEMSSAVQLLIYTTHVALIRRQRDKSEENRVRFGDTEGVEAINSSESNDYMVHKKEEEGFQPR